MTNSTRISNRNRAKDTEATNDQPKTGEAIAKSDEPRENEAKEEEIGPANEGTTSEKQEGSETAPSNDEAENTASEAAEADTLFHLIGHNIPCLPLEVLKRHHPTKPPSSNPSPRWTLAPFHNPARTDGLKLKHWVRSDDSQVYRFAKFNTTSNIFSYSTEEYYHFLRDDDWTKEETDYLFELLNTYDLRFPIVHDRYEYVGSRERSLDDLKARYYSICQKLIQHRPSTSASTADESSKKQSLIQSYNFDKQREVERKKHVKSLLNRSKAQLMEEEFIYIETRRLEQTLLKRTRNRNELIKLTGSHHHEMLNELKFWPVVDQPQQSRQSNNQSSGVGSTGNPSINPIQLKKTQSNLRRSETVDEDVSTGVGADEPDPNPSKVPGATPVNSEAQIEQDRKNCIYRFDPSSHNTGSKSTGGTHYRSVGLRSTRITLPKTVAASTRISTVMNELKIPSLLNYLPKPLMMPTRENVETYERLIQAINQLVEVKRIVDRVESELKTQRKKLDSFQQHHHHHHHSNHPQPSASHQPVKLEADTPAAITSTADSAISQGEAKGHDSSSVEPGQAGNKLDSPTINPFKLNLNKKRSVSISSSCSNNTGGDLPSNPTDPPTTNNINQNTTHKSRNHSNSRKKMRKN